MSTLQIVLASSSPYRRKLLENIGLAFTCLSPDIDESRLPSESPQTLAERLSKVKAQTIATEFQNALIIGSDQVAELGDQIIGKPDNHRNAVEQLLAASGKQMRLYSSVSLLNTRSGDLQTRTEVVLVEYRDLSLTQIERYLAADQPYDCCGSLKVESLGISLLRRIDSNDPNAIIGLPLIALIDMLIDQGVFIP